MLRRCHSIALPFAALSPPLARPFQRLRRCSISSIPSRLSLSSLSSSPFATISVVPFSTGNFLASGGELAKDLPSKQGPLKPGLYLVGTPIGNLEDITLRALRVLKSADIILSEDTRHSGKLLHYYNIRTPLLSYHKFNESEREQVVLKRLLDKEIVALISDAGMPGISDPGMELAKLCVDKNIAVIPVPGPSAVVAALSASGLPTNEFTFVGFLPKHGTTRRERLMVSANSATTQVFFVPPHKLFQFVEETSSIFGQHRRCVIAREMTKLHEEFWPRKKWKHGLYCGLNVVVISSCMGKHLIEQSINRVVLSSLVSRKKLWEDLAKQMDFWRGTLGEALEAFSAHQPKGEITLLIEGMTISDGQTLSETQLENELGELISQGHSLSMAVKLVAPGTSMKRKAIYSLALEKFGKHGSSVKK